MERGHRGVLSGEAPAGIPCARSALSALAAKFCAR